MELHNIDKCYSTIGMNGFVINIFFLVCGIILFFLFNSDLVDASMYIS